MTVYVYSLDNPEVNNPYSTEDYGLISSASTSSEDIGSVSDSSPTFNFLEDDWYNVSVTESLTPYGNLSTLSSSQNSTTYQYISSGILFEFTPQTLTENVVFTWIGNGTVFEIGNGLERTVNAYLSSGTLRVDTTVAETALESITVNPVEDTILYAITGSYSDLQFISNVPENTQLFTTSGTALESETESYVGLGSLSTSGSALERFITGNYSGSGTLFSLDTAEESITYDYNESSIQTGNFVDYGVIADSSLGIPLDYGQVPETPDPQINDYDLVINPVIPIVYPFGGMSLSGSAICSANYRLYIDGRAIIRAAYSEFVSGTITLSTTALESETESYVGSGTHKFDVGIFKENPQVNNTNITYDSTNITYDSTTIDFSLDIISYDAIVSFAANPPEDLVLYTFSGTALEAYSAQTPENTQLFNISGSLVEKNTESYVGLGTLTFSGTALEAYSAQTPEDLVLYTFSGTALEAYSAQTPEDLVLYTFSGTALEAYSAQTPENTQLFNISGSLVEKNTESYVGLGTLTFSGIVIEKNTESYVGLGSVTFSGTAIEKNTESYVGLGTLTFSGTALEAYSAQTPEDFVLYTFNGSLIEKNTESYVGSGTLFGFGNLIERITYSYNESSITEGAIDYGLIIPGAGLFDDYGFLNEGGPTEDFGEVSVLAASTVGELLYPFGTVSIAGTSLESYSAQTPEDTQLFVISGVASCRETANYPYFGDTPTLVLSGELVHPNIDYTPHYGIEKNIGIGTTGIQISGELVHPNIDYTPHYGIEKNIGIGTTGIQLFGTALESYSAQIPEDTQLFSISGTGLESYSAQTPEDIVLYTFNGSLIEKNTESYVGVGSATFSGTTLESYSAQTPENTQLFSISGQLIERFVEQADENTQLFSIFGIALESETESYVGLGTLTFSGIAIEKNTESYVGVGSATFSGTALESYSAQTPEDTLLFSISGELVHPNIDYTPHYGIEKNIGIGTTGIKFLRGIGTLPDSEGNLRDAKTYSNRYPINDKVPGTGIGTFRFDQTNNLAKYSPLTPYTGTGLFDIVTGFSPQESYPWLPGPGVGKSWSFTRSTYITSGKVTISGNGLTRPVKTFTYTGSGNVTISEQTSPILEKEVDVYIGSGSLTFGSGSLPVLRDSKWRGSGTLFGLSGVSESLSAKTPNNTILYQFSSSANESLLSIPPTDEVIFVIGGESTNESITISEIGTGVIPVDIFGTAAVSSYTPSISNTALFKFTQYTSDGLYDSCDSENISCDYQDASNVKFVANPVDNTILFEFSGIASTKEFTTYSYSGDGIKTISGSYQSLKFTSSEVGFGTIFITTSSGERDVNSYVGSGSLFGLSGGSESYSSQNPESTILISISGSALTKTESEYSVVGIGLFDLTGESLNRKISTYTQIGSGIATLVGELLYPNVQFIPSYITSGSINIIGSSDNSNTKIYENSSGTLFGISSGSESFTKSPYVGVGSIYIQEISGSTIDNPFQIPRTYVVII